MSPSIKSEQTLTIFEDASQGPALRLVIDPVQRVAEFTYKGIETQVVIPIPLTDIPALQSFMSAVGTDAGVLALIEAIKAADALALAAAIPPEPVIEAPII